MDTNDEPTAVGGSVIDLAPISSACRDLVAWYDRQLAGEQPKVTELERIVAAMKALPVLPGRLGRDIDLVITGGDSSSPGDTVGAIERLRLVASHNPPPRSSPPTPKSRDRERRTRRQRSARHRQEPLPGFDAPSKEAPQWRTS
ncbi:MAG: hypothetical protein R2710_24775 [Acidimicrobiales bacterium]